MVSLVLPLLGNRHDDIQCFAGRQLDAMKFNGGGAGAIDEAIRSRRCRRGPRDAKLASRDPSTARVESFAEQSVLAAYDVAKVAMLVVSSGEENCWSWLGAATMPPGYSPEP